MIFIVDKEKKMKITDVQTYPLMYMKDAPRIPRSFLLVKVTTDEGLFGFGECSSAYGHSFPLVVKEIIDHTLKRLVVGEDPRDIERLVSKMRTWIWGYLGPVGVSNQAIAAVEIALWDIVGKAANMPVYKMLGANMDEIEVYATGATNFEVGFDWHCDFFDRCLKQGFKGVKVRVGKSKDWDEEFVRTIREFVGPDCKLMIDAYMTYRPETAFEMAERFAKYKPYFYEEPISQYDLVSLKKISEQSPIPIALGERVTSLYEFKSLIQNKIGSIFQPDATIAGGIAEAKKICALAEAFSIECIPHIGGLTSVGIAANLHLALACRNVKLLEVDGAAYQPLRDKLLKDPIFDPERLVDGMMRPSDKPGLGIEVDESVFSAYEYERGPIYPDHYPQYGSGIL